MNLGLNLAVFGDRPLERALADAAALGVQTVELNAEAGDPHTPASRLLAPGGAEAVRRAVEAEGLRISALGNHAEVMLLGGPFHADTDRFCPGSASEKAVFGRARLLDTARAASALGVATVVGFVGCEDYTRHFPWPDPGGFERMIQPFVETWSPLLDELGRLGLRFAHEPHPKQLVYDLESALLVSAALGDRPEWGYNLDTANLALTGVDPAAFVDALPGKVFHVHAKDLEFVSHNLARSGWAAHGRWDRPDRGVRFRVPGWGDVNFKRVISSLQLAGYTGAISVEHEDPCLSRDEGAAMAVAHLRPIVPRDPPQPRWW